MAAVNNDEAPSDSVCPSLPSPELISHPPIANVVPKLTPTTRLGIDRA